MSDQTDAAATPKLDGTTYIERAPGVVWTEVEGQAVLVVPDAAQAKVLNAVGSRIWDLADGRRTVDGIAAALTDEFEVDLERARADAVGFLTELAATNLVRLHAQPVED